ncbi:MAG: hypothetical protein JXB85_00325, partial [Anaerolineales bacterium]|nr:hypothetical protein [Anaerolineales bacterium]
MDTAESLKMLVLASSRDPRYAAPPCGLVLDFNYASRTARKVLNQKTIDQIPAQELGRTLSLPAAQDEASVDPPKKRKRSIARVLITCGSLGVVGLLIACLVGLWLGMRSSQIPALPFLDTPTITPTPTATATPTRTIAPTSTPSPTATEVVFSIDITDDFSTNRNSWPSFDSQDEWAITSVHVQDGAYIWEFEAVQPFFWYLYPERLPFVGDFDFEID